MEEGMQLRVCDVGKHRGWVKEMRALMSSCVPCDLLSSVLQLQPPWQPRGGLDLGGGMKVRTVLKVQRKLWIPVRLLLPQPRHDSRRPMHHATHPPPYSTLSTRTPAIGRIHRAACRVWRASLHRQSPPQPLIWQSLCLRASCRQVNLLRGKASASCLSTNSEKGKWHAC
ncbi:hypothetical protein M011DRAFT_81517 [Sporormia fimetaria CBS 119925]|uniref:Uncharacterized protein n=1 Tax=Sporormia fimetaria CBS 119925 TaxID=1340428 RepID=A0A6A6V995_9PLEO|nr:hypothetical protein M011DRAFT_81517 [Sporormia fimetaria CBS 119925]